MMEAEESRELDLDDSRMTSPVVEIISGMTPGAIQSLEEAVQRAAASLNEGDDSVFYDEGEAPLDGRGGASSQPQCGDAGLPNFEAAGVSAQSNKDDTMLLEHLDTVLTKEHSEPHTVKRDTVGATPEETTSTAPASAPEEPVSHTSGKPLADAPAETLAVPQTQPRQDLLSGGGSASCKEEMTSPTTQSQEKTPAVRQRSVPELCALLNKETSGDDGLRVSGESQEEVEENCATETKQDNNSSMLCSSSSSQSLGEKSGCTSLKSSNHNHVFSKYNTVSFRKIRRGNTRQKIDEFESMMNV